MVVINCKNGISSTRFIPRPESHPEDRMVHASSYPAGDAGRLARQARGEVEVDETFIGGKARNMHKDRKRRNLEGAAAVLAVKRSPMGMLERGGKIRDAKSA